MTTSCWGNNTWHLAIFAWLVLRGGGGGGGGVGERWYSLDSHVFTSKEQPKHSLRPYKMYIYQYPLADLDYQI